MSDPKEQFVKLHNSGETFVVPNPWDVGTAKILANLGFKALATTSAGMAFRWAFVKAGPVKRRCWRIVKR